MPRYRFSLWKRSAGNGRCRRQRIDRGCARGDSEGTLAPDRPGRGDAFAPRNSLIFFFYSRIDACDALTFRTRWAIYMRAMFALALERSPCRRDPMLLSPRSSGVRCALGRGRDATLGCPQEIFEPAYPDDSRVFGPKIRSVNQDICQFARSIQNLTRPRPRKRRACRPPCQKLSPSHG